MAYIGRNPDYGLFEKQTITPDSTTTVFELRYAVGSANGLLVMIDGSIMEPSYDYSVSSGGTHIVFASAPVIGARVYLVFLGKQYLMPHQSGMETVKESFVATAWQTVFTLSIPVQESSAIVFVNGAYKAGGVGRDYTISGNTLTFASGIPVGNIVDVYELSQEVAISYAASTNLATNVTGLLPVAHGGTGVDTLTGYVKSSGNSPMTASPTIPNTDISGLGTMATENANTVTITGGTITGITDLAIADGGTGASTAAGARSNLGLGTMALQNASSISITAGTITNPPTASTDIVNKSYVDSISSGINFHPGVHYATTDVIGTYTYNNGTLGVGATLTGANGVTLEIDGHTMTTTDVTNGTRILVKDEVGAYVNNTTESAAFNGVYVVTAVSTGPGDSWELTRATDFDTAGGGNNEIDAGDLMYIISGTANANTSWVQQNTSITVGTSEITFVEFGAGLSPGGSANSIQYNNGSNFAGSTTFVYNSGSVGIGLSNPAANLDVAGTVKLGGSGSNTITLTGQVSANSSVGSSGQVLTSRGSNLSPEWTTISGFLSGSGTTNYIPKFTGTSAIGNSVIYDDGTNVGIGTNNPAVSLDISASSPRIRLNASTGTSNSLVHFANTGGNAYIGLDNSTGGLGGAYSLNMWHSGAYPIVLATNNIERMHIDSSGNVGINTSAIGGPTEKLHVVGKVKTTGGVLPRVAQQSTVSTTLTWDSSTTDVIDITAQATTPLTVAADSYSGVPTNGQKVTFRITTTGAASVVTFSSGSTKTFRAMGTTTLTNTINTGYTLYIGCIYNSTADRWDIVASAQGN